VVTIANVNLQFPCIETCVVRKYVKVSEKGDAQYYVILKWIFENWDWDIDWIYPS